MECFVIYLISIPLGIKKARLHGTVFDQSTSLLLAVAYAVPAFIFAILLIVFFAGSYFQWFPLQGLVSENFADLSLWGKIKDYFWHMALPLLSDGDWWLCHSDLSHQVFVYGRARQALCADGTFQRPD